jgi:hypothetical protein
MCNLHELHVTWNGFCQNQSEIEDNCAPHKTLTSKPRGFEKEREDDYDCNRP